MLYPLRFEPLYFEKVWGDRRLETYMGRQLPAGKAIGESWEVSDHPHGLSVVANGAERGKTLHALIKTYGRSLLGSRACAQQARRFPLLVKYIDAGEELSVQVHPDDAYAAEHAGELGKTEMWYVLHADPDACLIAGLKSEVTKEQFCLALDDGDPAILLHHMPVKTGDSIFIPAGRIHAIMPGLLILEIQQNSDTTYRLYDWGRVGLDGKPRELHVNDAVAVANWADYAPQPSAERVELEGTTRKTVLATCPYFTVEKFDIASEHIFPSDPGSFHILNCVAGEGVLHWIGGTESLRFGDTLLLPADLGEFALHPNGEASYVIAFVP
ncbi:MAG: type I phosphomannose isomerase catalytic subunit [Armatimonadota bacterium]